MITHPEKVLFPADGKSPAITKGELAAYYEAIAPVMVPHVRGRPVTMERYPAGIDKKGFIQKDVSKGFPSWLERVEVPKEGGTVNHPLINDVKSLLWVVNQNCVTPHVWNRRVPNLYHPDICIFDLDPGRDEPDVLRAAALAVRDLLDELGLPSWIKTSGSKGYHIAVPLDGKAHVGDVARFAGAVGDAPRQTRSEASDAGVQQEGSGRTHSRRHRTQQLQRDVRRPLRRSSEVGSARFRPVHVGRSRVGNRRTPIVHDTDDGGARRAGWRLVGGPQEAPPIAHSRNR